MSSSPMPKAATRRRRRQDGVDAIGEDLLEIALDQRADLLRLHVIGVVVAGRQHIGADHDAALHLAPKPLARVSSYMSVMSLPVTRRPYFTPS
jgi:hypothetical protein